MITYKLLQESGFEYNQAYNFWQGFNGVPDIVEVDINKFSTIYYKFGPNEEDFLPETELKTKKDLDKLIKFYETRFNYE